MKAKVIRKYRDKYTKDLQEVGTELEVTKGRYEEINSTAYGIFLEEVKEDYHVEFENMTKSAIIKYAETKDIDLTMNMTKVEMIKRVGG